MPNVRGGEVQAVVRTEMAVYFRCYSCNRVWGEPKPLASRNIRDALEALNRRLAPRAAATIP